MCAMLAPISPPETEQAKNALLEMERWLTGLTHLSPQEIKNWEFNDALTAANQAIVETRKYLKHRREGKERDADIENNLSEIWTHAAEKIQPFDATLANLCWVKGNGWADETTWNAPENRQLPVRVDQMLHKVRQLAENPPPKDLPAWAPIAGVAFTFLSVVSLFYLLVSPQGISEDRRVIFDVWVAFCLAASFSFIGGTAKARGRLPWLGNSPIQFAAYGGIAVFILAFILLYSAYR